MKIKFAAALAIALSAAAPSIASGDSRPDVRISSLIDPPSALFVGAQFSTAATVENRGDQRASTSRTRFYLSRDSRRDAGDVSVATLATRALRPGAETQRTVRVQLSETLAAGKYFLLVCADASRQIRESDERNNCIGSAYLLNVLSRP